MKAAKRTTALIIAAFMVLMMFPAAVLAADPGAPVFRGWGMSYSGELTIYTISYTEAATIDYVILPYGAAQPTAAQVKNHQDASGNPVDAPYSRTVQTEGSGDQHDAFLLRSDDTGYPDIVPGKYNLFIIAYDAESNTTDVIRWNFYGTPYSFEITAQLTFTVNDGTNPISGATVKVGSETKTTGGDGKAVFTLSGGVYSYLIQASGFQGFSNSYTADKQTDEITVSLIPGIGGHYSAIFNVKDDKDTNLKNAKITIGGVTKTADADGNAEFFLTPGDYSYSASAMGRITKNGSITVSTENISTDVVLSTDPAGVDLVIDSHHEGELGAEIDAILSANCLGADAVRSLTVNGGEMNGADFDEYHGIGMLNGYSNDIFSAVDLSGTVLDGNTLPEGAFYYFKHLADIKLPESMTAIGDTAFQDCDALTSYTVPDGVTNIGSRVFANCNALTSLTLPNSVTTIGPWLFGSSIMDTNIAPVANVYMSSENPDAISVDANAFKNNHNAVLRVVSPASVSAYISDSNDGSIEDGKWYGLWISDPDGAAPVISGIMAGWLDDDSAYFAISSDSPGQFYFAMVDDGGPVPLIDTSGTGTAVNGGLEGFSIFEGPASAKDLYIVLKGVNEKLSNILKMDMPAADAAPADITVNGHTEGNLRDEINAELAKVNLSYNYDKVGGLTVNGGTINSDDADFICYGVYYLTGVDFSGTAFEDNTVPSDFLYYSYIETVILPGNVEAIGDWAFSECSELKSITLGSSIPPAAGEGVFEGAPDGAVVYVPSGSKGAYLAAADGNTADDKWYGLTVVEIRGSGSGGNSQVYRNRTLTDFATGVRVSGSIRSDSRLKVKPLELHDDPACDAIRKAIESGDLIAGFDIELTGDFIGQLTVSIPVDGKYNGRTVTLLHCAGGRLETITATAANGIATFTVYELSPFAVTRGSSDVPVPPKTGDTATLAGFIMLFFAALCFGCALVKRRKA
ncbi:MAG: hypothetical protein BWY11_01740 [Firmicutes bacterium ADurb.Bin182]|nr:MAG: hypothetical protein BWY11_01740 [Firmicutes bacterium ADurb.Bin182]